MKKGHAHIGTFLGYIYMSEMMGHAVGDNTKLILTKDWLCVRTAIDSPNN